jgi:hypothetical protein
MKKSLFSAVAATTLLAGVALASAQSSSSSTTTTWTNDQGQAIRQYSTTQHYSSFSDPSLQPTVGMALPDSVTLYPVPQTAQIPDSDAYSYTIINNQPVVVERTTRKVVHTWQ